MQELLFDTCHLLVTNCYLPIYCYLLLATRQLLAGICKCSSVPHSATPPPPRPPSNKSSVDGDLVGAAAAEARLEDRAEVSERRDLVVLGRRHEERREQREAPRGGQLVWERASSSPAGGRTGPARGHRPRPTAREPCFAWRGLGAIYAVLVVVAAACVAVQNSRPGRHSRYNIREVTTKILGLKRL